MFTVTSSLSLHRYRDAVKENLGSHFALLTERFTGIFIGKWFYITHHAGYRWNERYTNQTNAAIGRVKETDDGCQVRFITFKGLLCPGAFFTMLVFGYLFFLLGFASEGLNSLNIWTTSLIGPGVVVIMAPILALIESLTPRSAEGKRILLAMLLDPTDPFSLMNNNKQIPY